MALPGCGTVYRSVRVDTVEEHFPAPDDVNAPAGGRDVAPVRRVVLQTKTLIASFTKRDGVRTLCDCTAVRVEGDRVQFAPLNGSPPFLVDTTDLSLVEIGGGPDGAAVIGVALAVVLVAIVVCIRLGTLMRVPSRDAHGTSGLQVGGAPAR
jgi:hypothetical protein